MHDADRQTARVRYVPPPDRIVSSSLLNFETPQDLAFLTSSPNHATPRIQADPTNANNHVLLVPAGSQPQINVAALTRGREFPGPWDLIGMRYRMLDSSGPPAVTFDRSYGQLAMSQVHADASPTASGEWHTLWFTTAEPFEPATSQRAMPAASYQLVFGKNAGAMLIDDVVLPAPRRGDLLAVPATGAYTLAMASNYNGVPRPAAVLLRNGSARIVRRRETIEDLLRAEVG